MQTNNGDNLVSTRLSFTGSSEPGQAEIQQLREEMAQMKSHMEAQQAQLLQMQKSLAKTKGKQGAPEAKEFSKTSRRAMLRRLGGTAAGLAAFTAFAGTAMAGDPAVDATGDASSLGGRFSSAFAPLNLAPAASGSGTGRNAAGHTAGDMFTEGNGTDSALFYFRGSSIGWTQVTNYTQFPTARRAFFMQSGLQKDQTFAGATAISGITDINGAPTGVPLGATSIYCGVSATPTDFGSAGFGNTVMFLPDGNSTFITPNWSAHFPNVTFFSYLNIPLNPNTGKFGFKSQLSGQLIIDVWGFTL